MPTTLEMSHRRPGIGARPSFVPAFALGVLALAAGAGAQPILFRDEFDLNADGWEAADPDSLVLWEDVDAGACAPDSGAALATHGGAAAGSGRNFVPLDCVGPIVAGASYSMGAALRFPAGQSRTGSARMEVVWTTGGDCTGTVAGVTFLPEVSSVPGGTWLHTSTTPVPAPAGAQGASLRIRAEKNEAGGALDLQFDRVYLARRHLLFVDGFEPGSTCRWALVVD